ncbi:helix-turn-helix domain-containing protein [Streptomyces sp. NPDC002018]|uniref:helix-turn-helix domain-containing protein n=1 Tax=Streptomyces sp. NPDC002018 TaxID=3364629 RepID=UPI00367C0AC0
MARHDAQSVRTLIARSEADRWTPWQLSAAISERCGCSLLKAHRLGRDWTLHTACERLAQSGGRVTVQQLSAWETGRGRPGESNLDLLCRMYETRPDRLGYGHDYTPSGESETDSSGSDRFATKPRENQPAPIGLTSMPPTSTALSALASVRRSMTTILATPIAETTIEQWDRQAAEYGHAYQITPPATLLASSIGDLLELRALLEQRQPTDVRTRLCRIAAQLAGTAGIALVALGEHREARQWYHLGQLLAEETGDRALRAWLLAREAVIPLYFGAPAAALALAERARLVAGSTVCATAAWAPSLETRALARLGRVREARDAMALAQRAFSRLGTSDTSDTAYGYTERQLVWHGGSMWTTLGDSRRAQAALHAARDLYSPDEHLDRALIAMDEATCLVGVGEIAVACRETEMLLLGLPAEHRTGIVVSRARDLLASIPARGSTLAAVGDLRELVEVSARPELTTG